MKNLNKIIFLILGVIFSFALSVNSARAACNWNSLRASTNFWDSCKGKYAVNGYIVFKTGSCLKYQWTVNGNKAGNNYIMSYPVTSNGTYTICVKVSDTCNKCDTTYCTTRSFTCISNCNWSTRKPSFYFIDSCVGFNNTYSLNSYIGFNYSKSTCFKYNWTVNASNAGTSQILNYIITKNGTYSVCLKVTDTCNKCDTTFCSTRKVTCIKGTCNWKAMNASTNFWDSCSGKRNSLNGYVVFKTGKCLSYQWTVNGKKAGTNYILNYPITTNGSYTICVKVTDSCNNCDTTYCYTKYISCISGGKCNWKSKKPQLYFWDSCTFSKSLVGWIDFNSSSCLSYKWTVNGVPAGTSGYMTFSLTKNGTYSVCVKVIDSCNNCDTTYCANKTITCIKSSTCNWKSRKPTFHTFDSCDTRGNSSYVGGWVTFNYSNKNCFKYECTVNGKITSLGFYTNKTVTSNGSYVVCIKVTDTCNNCDTTFCSTRYINCMSTKKCNWKSKKPAIYFWDSCQKYQTLNGYIDFGTSSCLLYQWTINGKVVNNYAYMSYNITQNGTYTMCVKVMDTCNNCDTTYCSTKVVTCFKTNICNWKSRKPTFLTYDSCNIKNNEIWITGWVSFNYSKSSCLKYQWTMNGKNLNNSYHTTNLFRSNGNYTLCLKVTDTCNNCDTTFCSNFKINCLTSEVSQLNSADKLLKIYPNPTAGLLNLDWLGGTTTYYITNMSGQILQSGSLENGNNTVDLNKYSNGLYLFRINNGTTIISEKISVQKR